MKNVILYKAIDKSKLSQDNFDKLFTECDNVFMLFDDSNKKPFFDSNAMNYNEQMFRNSNYPVASEAILDKCPKNRQSIMWYNPEFSTLAFYRQYPDLDYYWATDYDVHKLNGSYRDLFSDFDDCYADLLATYVRPYPEPPPFSCFWDLNFACPDEKKIAAFGSLVRYSNKMLETLDKEYSAGKHGFCDVIIPTLANLNDLAILDMNQHNGKVYYDEYTWNCGITSHLWTEDFINSHKDYLFHPVR